MKEKSNGQFVALLTGTRPLMINSTAGVRKTGTIGRRIAEINAQRRKTESDEEERDRLSFMIALYHDSELGLYVPGHSLWAAGRDGAKMYRQGTKWIEGVVIVEDKLPIEYDGPKLSDVEPKGPTLPELLYADARFVDARPGNLQGKKIIAVRPVFFPWSLKATFIVDDTSISVKDAQRALVEAGMKKGLGTYRQRFGRFDVEFE
jgi:hypothetical protein